MEAGAWRRGALCVAAHGRARARGCRGRACGVCARVCGVRCGRVVVSVCVCVCVCLGGGRVRVLQCHRAVRQRARQASSHTASTPRTRTRTRTHTHTQVPRWSCARSWRRRPSCRWPAPPTWPRTWRRSRPAARARPSTAPLRCRTTWCARPRAMLARLARPCAAPANCRTAAATPHTRTPTPRETRHVPPGRHHGQGRVRGQPGRHPGHARRHRAEQGPPAHGAHVCGAVVRLPAGLAQGGGRRRAAVPQPRAPGLHRHPLPWHGCAREPCVCVCVCLCVCVCVCVCVCFFGGGGAAGRRTHARGSCRGCVMQKAA
jgi:hypothetical protein